MRVSFGWMLGTEPPASLRVEFETDRGEVVDYAVLLLAGGEGNQRTVRVYDGSHGINELHRYTSGGRKQPAEVFHRGTLGDGMRFARQQIEDSYEAMIESWQRRT